MNVRHLIIINTCGEKDYSIESKINNLFIDTETGTARNYIN